MKPDGDYRQKKIDKTVDMYYNKVVNSIVVYNTGDKIYYIKRQVTLMDKWIKFFPFMPEPKDTNKLIIAILFYVFVPSIVGSIIGFFLGLTIVLLPLAFVVGPAVTAYTVIGIVFAVLRYMDRKI